MLSEDANERSINLAVRVAKVSGKEIYRAIEKILADKGKAKNKPVPNQDTEKKVKYGRTTKKQLDREIGEQANIELKNPDLRMLNSFMKKERVRFAVTKDGNGYFTLYFKANKVDDVTTAFQKYSRKVLSLGRAGPSVRRNLAQARGQALTLNNNRNAERNRNRGGLER